MKDIHNFSAGPSILPKEVINKASAAVKEYDQSGLSILEMSHRSDRIESVIHRATQSVSNLLDLPDNYKVLFLTGGASSQFFMAPLNLLPQNKSAAYINTGRWSVKAIKEAKLYGNIELIASSEDDNFSFIPKDISINENHAYLHITSNNTVAGTQYQKFPDTDIPLVADMSSDIFTRKIEANKFGLIYAGAQKNMGPAGTTLVIVNEDLLGKTGRDIPTMLDYKTHIERMSAFNTPPVYPIYVSMLYLNWIEENGGIKGMRNKSKEKSELLYNEIDRNSLFEGEVAKEDRSHMNATFSCKDSELTDKFLNLCTSSGISGIKGHRSVGGFRASMYNAMPLSSVEFLVELMQKFEKENS